MIKKNKNQIVKNYSGYDLEGDIQQAIDMLQNIRDDMNNKGFDKVNIAVEHDYSSRYYEGDAPSIQIIVTGTKT